MTDERTIKEYANGDELYKRDGSCKYNYILCKKNGGFEQGCFYATSEQAAKEYFRVIRKGK